MTFKSLSYWFWFAVLTLLALMLANTPLFNLLAFEFCAVLAFGISFAGAHTAITGVSNLRQRTQSLRGTAAQTVMSTFWRTFGINLTLLLPPLIIILLNGFRVKNCDFFEGFIFFLLLPVISCAYATALGVFFGLWLKRRWRAYLAYLAYIFATLLALAYNLIFHPPVFGYHSTFGYFPGPIYDERIVISSALLIARGTTLLLAWIFLSLAINTLEIGRHTRLEPTLYWQKLYRFKRRFSDLSHRICLIVLIILFGLIYLFCGDLGLRPTRGYIESKLGGLEETAHFKIYYEKGSQVEREIEWIAQDHEFRYAQLIRYFQIQPTNKVRSYIYTSSEQKKRLVGAGGTSVEDPLGHGFHINYQDFPHPIMKHELVHALTADWHPILKVSPKIGLHEGIAVAADWDEGKLTAHQWSRAMQQLGIAPKMNRIMGLGFWTQASSRSYTLAGSFVRFLIERYGVEKIKRVFPTGNFKEVYNKSLAELEREWKEFLETVTLTEADLEIAAHRFKRPSIFQKPCAHEIAQLSADAWRAYRRSNMSTAIRLFEQVYQFDPDNPRHLRGLMYTHYQAEDYPSTLEWASRIVAHPKASVSRVAEAKNVEGNVYWQQGKREDARSRYQEVFALHASDSLDRESQAKLAALAIDSLDVENKIRQFLIGQLSSRLRMTLLHEVVNALPEWGLGHYLIGRQLYFDREYAASNLYLSKAAVLGLPHQNLAIENMRLIGVNLYRLGQYAAAIEQFRRITAHTTLPLGTVHSAKDWIERCEWAIMQLSQSAD